MKGFLIEVEPEDRIGFLFESVCRGPVLSKSVFSRLVRSLWSVELDGSGFGVPGADDLTSVATEDPWADVFSHFGWNVTFVFDGPVADASVCVEDIRGSDSFSWASIDAGLAGAAVREGRGLFHHVLAQIDFREDRGKEEIAAEFFVQ